MVTDDENQPKYKFVCYWNPKAGTSPFAFSDEMHDNWIPLYKLEEQLCQETTTNK